MTTPGEMNMQWSKPAYTEMRLGFEVTMYVSNR
jgi:pyrroloquinoline quinone biosynthesis protein A